MKRTYYSVNITFLFLLLFAFSCQSPDSFNKESISTVKQLPESHKKFIAEFYPNAVEANDKIKKDRAWIVDLKDNYRHVIVKGNKMKKLNKMAKEYRLGEDTFSSQTSKSDYKRILDSLLLRVDYIPEKLVMAQAIIESGWGSSKFSQEINNYFGIHCYTPGCGKAAVDVENPKFWVKSFSTKEACIQEYMWTLNTGHAYKNLRAKRFELRKEGKYPDAIMLAEGLGSYSEKGSEYIKLIQSIIKNYLPEDLDQFTKWVNAGEPELS